MLPGFEIIGFLSVVFFLAIMSYGALTKNNRLLSLGICLFSVIPIAGEVYHYLLSNHSIHLIFLVIFLIQMLVTLPTTSKAKTFVYLNTKTRIAILVVNLLHGCLILTVLLNVPFQFGYIHLVAALIIFYAIIKTNQK